MSKRDEIDTDPSSPQSRRGSTDPGIGPRSRTPAPGTARTPAPGAADSIDEILEGITNRPRADGGVPTPRVTPQTDGQATASYQANARAPNPATTTPGEKPAVILSPSVEMQALEEKVPSSMPRPLVRDASPRPAYVAPVLRNGATAPSLNGGRARSDVDTVLTPSAMFKRFLRRAVIVAVILAVALIIVASWKRGRPHDGASAAQTPPVGDVPVTGGTAVLPVLTTPPNAPNRAMADTALSVPPGRGTVPGASVSATSAVSNIAPAATSAPALVRVAPRGTASNGASPGTKVGSGLDSQGSAPKAPPPPAPGYEEFKKSFTP